MATAYTWLIWRNICGFIDHCDIFSSNWFITLVQPNKHGLTQKMEAAQSFEASRTASHPTRTEPSAHNSNIAERVWNQETVRPAEWTEQFLYCCCPTNQVSAAQSQCKWLNGCYVVGGWLASILEVKISTQNSGLPDPLEKNRQPLAWLDTRILPYG
jgi:hypothetical protein